MIVIRTSAIDRLVRNVYRHVDRQRYDTQHAYGGALFAVIAMDVSAKNIMLAKRNAELYGVADRIRFTVGDFFLESCNLRADAVITSPPWEELGNTRHVDFDAGDICNPESRGLATIIRMAGAVAPKVVLHLPNDVDHTQVSTKRLCRLKNKFEKKNYIDG